MANYITGADGRLYLIDTGGVIRVEPPKEPDSQGFRGIEDVLGSASMYGADMASSASMNSTASMYADMASSASMNSTASMYGADMASSASMNSTTSMNIA